jgi:hypothetical protein
MVFGLSPLTLFDLQNIVGHPKKPLVPHETSDDFTILVAIYNHPKYFKNKKNLSKYKKNLLLCIGVGNEIMSRFAKECKRKGFKVFESQSNDKLSLISEGVKKVKTKYIISLDPDSYFTKHPHGAIGAMVKNNVDIASVKVLPSKRETLVEKLQGVEYDVSMFSRLRMPWLTSGACIVAKTSVLNKIMKAHTRFYFGEDIEMGRLSLLAGYKIRHLDFVVLTEIPSSAMALFRQRVGWWAGEFRTTIVNFDTALRTPSWFLYYFFVVWSILPLKWYGLIYFTEFVPAVYFAYIAIIIIANWRVRSRYMLLFPFYSFFQSIILPPFGIYKYLKVVRESNNWGRYAEI